MFAQVKAQNRHQFHFMSNLTKVEVTQPQNQCKPLSEDFPVVPGVRQDNRLKDNAISHNVNKARLAVF